MNINIPKQYLIWGGVAIGAGLLFWYLKSSGIWDSWFNAAGQLVPAPPVSPADPQTSPTPPQQQPEQPNSFSLSFQPEKVN